MISTADGRRSRPHRQAAPAEVAQLHQPSDGAGHNGRVPLDQAVEEDGDVQDGTDVESCFDLLPGVHSGFQYKTVRWFWQGGGDGA